MKKNNYADNKMAQTTDEKVQEFINEMKSFPTTELEMKVSLDDDKVNTVVRILLNHMPFASAFEIGDGLIRLTWREWYLEKDVTASKEVVKRSIRPHAPIMPRFCSLDFYGSIFDVNIIMAVAVLKQHFPSLIVLSHSPEGIVRLVWSGLDMEPYKLLFARREEEELYGVDYDEGCDEDDCCTDLDEYEWFNGCSDCRLFAE